MSPEKVNFPITFQKGLLEQQEESVLDTGYLSLLENWIPEPTGALRVRRRWASGGTSGAPATRRTRGIGSIPTEEAFATPNRRQATFADVINSSAPSGSWAQTTAAGNLLLAAITAKRWIKREQGAATVDAASATWPQATVSGNTLVAIVARNAADNGAITPPAGWVSKVTTVYAYGGGFLRIEAFVIENAGVRSGAETFTFGGTAHRMIAIYEYSGVATASFDTSASATGASTTVSSGTTPAMAQRDEVAIAGLSVGGVNVQASFSGNPSNGFSTMNSLSWAGYGHFRTAEKITESGGTASTSNALTSSGTWVGVIITLKASSTAPTITTPSGWTLLTTATRVGIRTSLYYIQNAATRSGAQNFTLNANCRSDIALLEYSGIALTGALDQSATNIGASDIMDSITTPATTQDKELIVAFLFAGNATQEPPSDGFSTVGSVASRFTACEKTVTVTGIQNITTLLSGVRDWTAIIATFKAMQLSSAGAQYLVADDDGANFDIWRTSDIASGTWALLDGNVPATSLDRGSPVAFATGLDRVLWTHKDFAKTRSWDGNTLNPASDVTNAPRGRAMVFYRNRFFIGGTKAGAFGSNGSTSNVTRLWFSDLGSYTTWNNNDFLDIGKEDREPIEDIAPVAGGLLIAKRSSLWFVSGTGPDNFQVDQLEAGEGYPGRCICVGSFGAMIAGMHHLWMWTGGRPEMMSHPVEGSYSIGGSFVSAACAGSTVLICDSGSGVVWAHDHMTGAWWTEKLPAGNDQPAIVAGHEERFLFGPLASTLIGPLAYRDEPGSTRGRDVALATTYKAETPELYPGGAGRSVTPRHLYLELRQRGGDNTDAGLVVTPIYDGVEQAAQTVTPKAAAKPFTHRLDIGSSAGVKGVKFRFQHDLSTTDDAAMDIERAEFVGLMSPHR
jgi:hypothetical protein